MPERIVQIENEKDKEHDFPEDWEEMSDVLDAEGIFYGSKQ